ncbi:hypothetical protein [Vibrio sp. E14]|uniref:hypothetical protein n=1 Tax=Vibrio sp. E14 TaxID=2849869 RepID=UPI001CF8C17F|nr:hypothetical protein [Vibrio sp. E14]
MRKLDRPLYWVYKKTNRFPLTSVKGFFTIFALFIVVNLLVGDASQQQWVSIPLGLIGASIPLLMGFVLTKLKFNFLLNRIPKAEHAYFIQSDIGYALDKGVRWLISTYISLLLYLWLLGSTLVIVSMPILIAVS